MSGDAHKSIRAPVLAAHVVMALVARNHAEDLAPTACMTLYTSKETNPTKNMPHWTGTNNDRRPMLNHAINTHTTIPSARLPSSTNSPTNLARAAPSLLTGATAAGFIACLTLLLSANGITRLDLTRQAQISR